MGGSNVYPLRASLAFALLAGFGAVSQAAAPEIDVNANCSEIAKPLIDQAWAAQPMNKGPDNTADPARAQALYVQALADSPRCLRALRLVTTLLIRDRRFARASEYNERLLQSYPADPISLSTKARLLVEWKHDYQGALDIQKKVLEMQGAGNGAWYYRIAGTYSMMNNLDEALEYLQRAMAISKTWGDAANAQSAPIFANLRKDPRFGRLVSGR
jgi:tetratricopeptide (TPR) repeat protein